MKWVLDIERKDIEMDIRDNQFRLEAPGKTIQFEIGWGIAVGMIQQLGAILTPPFIQKESLVENVDGKNLMMDFVLTGNDNWAMDLSHGDDRFYAELSRNDLGRIAYVLDSYLNS